MKIIPIFIGAMLSVTSLLAKEKSTQTISAELKKATVYFGYGAELNHTAKATLPIGAQELVVSNLATQLDVNTIQVGCSENVVIMSYRFATKTETKLILQSLLIPKMQDTLKHLQVIYNNIENDLQNNDDIINRTTRLIEANLANNPKKEISSAELIRLVDYYTAKIQSLKIVAFTLQQKKNDINESIAGTSGRVNELQRMDQLNAVTSTTGQIILQLLTKESTTTPINISYFTRNAGWIPAYDVKVKTLENTIKLGYKATVTQTTGLDWDDVKISLSTGNPNQGNVVPILSSWYLNMYVPVLYEKMKTLKRAQVPKMQAIESTASGYTMKDIDILDDAKNVSIYTSESESMLYKNFEIDLPYSIPADGKAYNVDIKDEQMNAYFNAFGIPKLDRDAFVIADINDWEKYDLLPGEANIIMDNTYIGKSYIDPNSTFDTLRLPLGRDKRVALKRTLVKEQTKSKIKGDNKIETFTYEIVMRNNKKQAIELVVKDQYPLSKVNEVEVNLDESTSAEINNETGELKWKIKLQPGESKKLRFSYSVKYPKDKIIQNLR